MWIVNVTATFELVIRHAPVAEFLAV